MIPAVNIDFTQDKVRAFRRAYVYAIEVRAETFMFESINILTAYAKCMLDELATKFPDA